MQYETITFSKEEPIATVTLNRPDYLNALNLRLCEELLHTLRRCEWDDAIRSVVLTGTGRSFCAGGDVREMRAFMEAHPNDDPGIIIEEIVSAVNTVLLSIRQLKKPIIGAINGFCSGGGAGLAQACDSLIATEDAKIHIPNLNIGLVVDGGNSFFLVKNLGRYRTAALIFSGGSLSAEEALNLGIFNRLVPAEALLPEAEALARKWANGPGFAMGLAKDMLNKTSSATLEVQLEEEKEAVVLCAGSKEFKEGIRAFFEKRKPDFLKH